MGKLKHPNVISGENHYEPSQLDAPFQLYEELTHSQMTTKKKGLSLRTIRQPMILSPSL